MYKDEGGYIPAGSTGHTISVSRSDQISEVMSELNVTDKLLDQLGGALSDLTSKMSIVLRPDPANDTESPIPAGPRSELAEHMSHNNRQLARIIAGITSLISRTDL